MAHKKKNPWGIELPDLSSGQRALMGGLGGVALACAGAGVLFYMVDYYQQRILTAARPEPAQYVLVAIRDLHPGVKVHESDVYALAIPAKRVVEDMVREPELIVGRYPRERILANEFIRTERIANPEEGGGLNAVLPREMRALSIEIANGAALSGHLKPGSYVDILATYYPDDDTKLEETRTIAQGIFVLAVNERAISLTPQEERELKRVPRPSVTFLVTPTEAEKIAHAERTTAIRLALRNDLDDRYATTHGVDVNALLERLGVLEGTEGDGRSVTDADLRDPDTLRLIAGAKVTEESVPSVPDEEKTP